MTDEFLEYSAKQGNDLRGGMQQPDGSKAGLTGGCKWCVTALYLHPAILAVLPIPRVRHFAGCAHVCLRARKRLTEALASSPVLLSRVSYTSFKSARCLCVTRWKEAYLARDKLGDKVVPKVILEATHKDTLVSPDHASPS